jgi:hypothetical protein
MTDEIPELAEHVDKPRPPINTQARLLSALKNKTTYLKMKEINEIDENKI